jgi:undecaprenyl-diphosphatase
VDYLTGGEAMFLEYLKVLILGIVEGITEWLPISSTGHMILVENFLRLNVSHAFWEMFLVVIQLGAILAVCVIYFHKLNPFSPKKTAQEKKATWKIWYMVLIGCLPAAIIGLPLDDWLDEHFYNYVVVAIALIVYGIIFIWIETKYNYKPTVNSFEDMSPMTAFKIGCFQVLSLIPGTSRSGSTIIGGMLVGTSRTVATEFSFFMSIPIMAGASLLKLIKFGFHFTANELMILIFGMVVAFVVSIIAIKFLVSYIQKNDFKIFGYYRIILGIVVIIYFLMS